MGQFTADIKHVCLSTIAGINGILIIQVGAQLTKSTTASQRRRRAWLVLLPHTNIRGFCFGVRVTALRAKPSAITGCTRTPAKIRINLQLPGFAFMTAATADTDARLHAVLGRFGHDINHTAQRIRTIKCRHRSFDNLYALNTGNRNPSRIIVFCEF